MKYLAPGHPLYSDYHPGDQLQINLTRNGKVVSTVNVEPTYVASYQTISSIHYTLSQIIEIDEFLRKSNGATEYVLRTSEILSDQGKSYLMTHSIRNIKTGVMKKMFSMLSYIVIPDFSRSYDQLIEQVTMSYKVLD